MYDLPTSVTVNGESFKIRDKGDFRMVLQCFNILNAEDLNESEKCIACLMVFYEKFNVLEDVLKISKVEFESATREMFAFMNMGQNESENTRSAVKLIDWEKDSLLIASAINNVAGKEIRAAKYVHWWTFIGYYMAIGDCALSQIVAIRHKIAHGTKLEKYEKKFRQENPQFFNVDYRTTEQKQAEEYIRNMWNGGES